MFLVFDLISKLQDLSSNLRGQEGKPDQGLSIIQREESLLLFCPDRSSLCQKILKDQLYSMWIWGHMPYLIQEREEYPMIAYKGNVRGKCTQQQPKRK